MERPDWSKRGGCILLGFLCCFFRESFPGRGFHCSVACSYFDLQSLNVFSSRKGSVILGISRDASFEGVFCFLVFVSSCGDIWGNRGETGARKWFLLAGGRWRDMEEGKVLGEQREV